MTDPNSTDTEETEDDEICENYDTSRLYDADPECEHEVITLWSGVKCRKCNGWFCY